jgi:hypothetical protein
MALLSTLQESASADYGVRIFDPSGQQALYFL